MTDGAERGGHKAKNDKSSYYQSQSDSNYESYNEDTGMMHGQNNPSPFRGRGAYRGGPGSGDKRAVFYNPLNKTSVWENPHDLVGRYDVEELLKSCPEPGKSKESAKVKKSEATSSTSPLSAADKLVKETEFTVPVTVQTSKIDGAKSQSDDKEESMDKEPPAKRSKRDSTDYLKKVNIRDISKREGRCVYKSDRIVGRVVFHHKKILQSSRKNKRMKRNVRFARVIMVDENDADCQIRITGFEDQSHRMVNEFQKGRVFSLKNFVVKKSNKQFDFLSHPFELSLHEKSIVTIQADDASLPLDLVHELHDIKYINVITESSCIQIQGILTYVSETRTVTSWYGKTWTIKDITLMDKTASIDLTLWEDHAKDFDCRVGDVYRILGLKIIILRNVDDFARCAKVLRCSDHQADPGDTAGSELKYWYDIKWNKVARPTVDLTDWKQKSEMASKLFEETRKILEDNRNKNKYSPKTGGKFTPADACRLTGIDQGNFCVYMKRFRPSRQKAPSHPEKYDKAYEIYQKQPNNQKNATAAARSVGLDPANFCKSLRNKGLGTGKRQTSRGGIKVHELIAKAVYSGKENVTAKEACKIFGQSAAHFSRFKKNVGLPVGRKSKNHDYTVIEFHRQKFLRSDIPSQRAYCKQEGVHQSQLSLYISKVNSGDIIPPDVSNYL